MCVWLRHYIVELAGGVLGMLYAYATVGERTEINILRTPRTLNVSAENCDSRRIG